MNWREEYKRLGGTVNFKKYPQFYETFDTACHYVLYPKVSTANGLTKAIINFLSWSGHYANRISTQGQASIHKVPHYNIISGKMVYGEQVRFTPGNTKRGTPDITGIIKGRAVWIEVKVGKDRMSEAQQEQKVHIEEAGGIYYIARDMQEFVEWYYELFSTL